jgi:hypothetical protein
MGLLRSTEPAGLGAEYERLIRSGSGKGRRHSGVRSYATAISYGLASWFLSIFVTAAAFLATFGITQAFVTAGWAFFAGVLVLLALGRTWLRSVRRHRAPLIRLVPRDELESFRRWRDSSKAQPMKPERRWRLDFRVVKRLDQGE